MRVPPGTSNAGQAGCGRCVRSRHHLAACLPLSSRARGDGERASRTCRAADRRRVALQRRRVELRRDDAPVREADRIARAARYIDAADTTRSRVTPPKVRVPATLNLVSRRFCRMEKVAGSTGRASIWNDENTNTLTVRQSTGSSFQDLAL